MTIRSHIIPGILTILCMSLFFVLHKNSFTPLPNSLAIKELSNDIEAHIERVHNQLQLANDADSRADILSAGELNVLIDEDSYVLNWHIFNPRIADRDFYRSGSDGIIELSGDNQPYYYKQINDAQGKNYRYLCSVAYFLNVPGPLIESDGATVLRFKRKGFYGRYPWVLTILYLLIHIFVVAFSSKFMKRLCPGHPIIGSFSWLGFILCFRAILQYGEIDLVAIWPKTTTIQYTEWAIYLLLGYAFFSFVKSYRIPISPPIKSRLLSLFKAYITYFMGVGMLLIIGVFYLKMVRDTDLIEVHNAWVPFILIHHGLALLSALLFFLISRYFFNYISATKQSQKLIALFVACLTLSLITHSYLPTLLWLTAILLALIYYLILDLYVERFSKPSLNWQFGVISFFTFVLALLAAITVQQEHKEDVIERLKIAMTHLDNSPATIREVSHFQYDLASGLMKAKANPAIALNAYGDIVLVLQDHSYNYLKTNAEMTGPIPLKYLEIKRLGISNHRNIIPQFPNQHLLTLQQGLWMSKIKLNLSFAHFMWTYFTHSFIAALLLWILYNVWLRFRSSVDSRTFEIGFLSYRSKIIAYVFGAITVFFLIVLAGSAIETRAPKDTSFQKDLTLSYTDLSNSLSSGFRVLRFNHSFELPKDLSWYKDNNWLTSHYDNFPFPKTTFLSPGDILGTSSVQSKSMNGHEVLYQKKRFHMGDKGSLYVMASPFSWNVLTLVYLIIVWMVLIGSRQLTAPLRRLERFNTNQSSAGPKEPIEWTEKDEIGMLITTYNGLLTRAANETDEKVKAEREGAWREMAKQVAHEIKNPLTPMKLSLQYLQSRLGSSEVSEEVSSIAKKVSNTLIQQIDNLSKIANSFSSFARLPEPKFEITNLNELLTQIHHLFENHKTTEFKLYVPIDDINVWADPHQLIQVFNNLIKNSLQAIPASRHGKVLIRLLDNDDQYAVVEFSDNGQGITEDIRNKVFSPNFTTKNSGTGLGLAISHKIIESHKGQIYFKTTEGSGTTFIIKLRKFEYSD